LNIDLKKILNKNNYVLVLASGSSRRQKLLKKFDIPFKTIVPKVKEVHSKKHIRKTILNNALAKALASSASISVKKQPALVIAGDTVIVYNGASYGKPKNKLAAGRMLTALSGKTHKVLSSLIVYNTFTKSCEKAVVETKVTFKKLTTKEVEAYLNTQEYADKAGGYGIQDKGAFLVEKISGDYYNVVGLPLCALQDLLKKACLKISKDIKKTGG
jgi:nucleoside triphosphate pyrophosphatase